MHKSKSTMAQQIAQAAIAFEQRRTGNHLPKSVTVVLSEGTLVITLHEALSPAERALAQSPAGAIQMQEYHRQLFANSSDSLRQEIQRITGMEVREATAEIEPATGAVVQAFTTGTVVQVFLLAGSAAMETWMETPTVNAKDMARMPVRASADGQLSGHMLNIERAQTEDRWQDDGGQGSQSGKDTQKLGGQG
ncbi:MAG TPA: Na-translocating system protein MpsC family protein [Gemmataceae bacterium]|jgi:uncharacterized protein YbcI|nr:Na-translocating system protein MpsC family protein [Gemmataceae bacterium]